MRRIAKILSILILVATLFGCSNKNTTSSVKEPAQIKGTIQSMLTLGSKDKITMIIIDSSKTEGSKYTSGNIAVDNQTEIYDKKGTPISVSELKEGNDIEVVFSGKPVEDKQVQASAKIIRKIK